jgi:hypothetical protein
MTHHDAHPDPDLIGRRVFLITVVSALAFALAAYLLVS